jgi:hypothetical protein
LTFKIFSAKQFPLRRIMHEVRGEWAVAIGRQLAIRY